MNTEDPLPLLPSVSLAELPEKAARGLPPRDKALRLALRKNLMRRKKKTPEPVQPEE